MSWSFCQTSFCPINALRLSPKTGPCSWRWKTSSSTDAIVLTGELRSWKRSWQRKRLTEFKAEAGPSRESSSILIKSFLILFVKILFSFIPKGGGWGAPGAPFKMQFGISLFQGPSQFKSLAQSSLHNRGPVAHPVRYIPPLWVCVAFTWKGKR